MPAMELKFKLPTKIVKKKICFVASCPILDVVTQGQTEQKARDNLIEALTLFLTTCIEMETLGEVLKQSGFKTTESGKHRMPEKDCIDIPIHLLVGRQGAKHCHA
jgi:predicted RNase H-like HicB family nuclease